MAPATNNAPRSYRRLAWSFAGHGAFALCGGILATFEQQPAPLFLALGWAVILGFVASLAAALRCLRRGDLAGFRHQLSWSLLLLAVLPLVWPVILLGLALSLAFPAALHAIGAWTLGLLFDLAAMTVYATMPALYAGIALHLAWLRFLWCRRRGLSVTALPGSAR